MGSDKLTENENEGERSNSHRAINSFMRDYAKPRDAKQLMHESRSSLRPLIREEPRFDEQNQ